MKVIGGCVEQAASPQ